jgi:hypothetical protein
MPEKPTRAVAYYRVATPAQADSLDRQRAVLRDMVARGLLEVTEAPAAEEPADKPYLTGGADDGQA